MTRPLTAGMRAAIAAPKMNPFLLFEATLADNSVVRYWTGRGTISWNSQTWLGTGQLIKVTAVQETIDLKTQDITVSVNGVPTSMVSLVEQSLRNGKPGIVRIGALDDSGNVIASPKVWFRGKLDGAQVDETDLENPVCNLRYSDDIAGLRIPNERRFTDAQQKAKYPGDRFLEFMPIAQDRVIEFGRDW